MAEVIEISLRLDLGKDAPSDLLGLARALAVEVKEEAIEVAATAAEASGAERVHAVVPDVRYRVLSEWFQC